MINYNCSKCHTAMSSPDSMAGQPETCPNCGSGVVVPDSDILILREAIASSVPPNRPPNRHGAKMQTVTRGTNRATITESAMAIIGTICFIVGGIIIFVGLIFLASKQDENSAIASMAARISGWFIISWGVGIAVSGFYPWAAHHVLRYLRMILDAERSGGH